MKTIPVKGLLLALVGTGAFVVLYATAWPSTPRGRRAAPTWPAPWYRSACSAAALFFCYDKYCSRYRPGARHGCSPDTGLSDVGFRCVKTGEK